MCHFNLGNLMDVKKRHITNRKCRDSGIHGQFDRSSLLREMTVGVEILASLNKCVPSPVYFDWRGCPYSLTLTILNILSLRKQRKGSYRTKRREQNKLWLCISYPYLHSYLRELQKSILSRIPPFHHRGFHGYTSSKESMWMSVTDREVSPTPIHHFLTVFRARPPSRDIGVDKIPVAYSKLCLLYVKWSVNSNDCVLKEGDPRRATDSDTQWRNSAADVVGELDCATGGLADCLCQHTVIPLTTETVDHFETRYAYVYIWQPADKSNRTRKLESAHHTPETLKSSSVKLESAHHTPETLESSNVKLESAHHTPETLESSNVKLESAHHTPETLSNVKLESAHHTPETLESGNVKLESAHHTPETLESSSVKLESAHHTPETLESGNVKLESAHHTPETLESSSVKLESAHLTPETLESSNVKLESAQHTVETLESSNVKLESAHHTVETLESSNVKLESAHHTVETL
ncbi:hypothetical protein J6590_027734 [Homalodisca vitripennis]|nr:hypothetical protein J6590_027734 [Homalodisca vitripennis]